MMRQQMRKLPLERGWWNTAEEVAKNECCGSAVNTGKSVGKYQNFLRSVYNDSGVSISTDGRRNTSATFFHKEKVTSLNNVVNKNFIVKCEWNVIMKCFPKGLLVFGYALVNFSEFYAEFVYVQK